MLAQSQFPLPFSTPSNPSPHLLPSTPPHFPSENCRPPMYISPPWYIMLPQDQAPPCLLRLEETIQQEERVPKAGNRVSHILCQE